MKTRKEKVTEVINLLKSLEEDDISSLFLCIYINEETGKVMMQSTVSGNREHLVTLSVIKAIEGEGDIKVILNKISGILSDSKALEAVTKLLKKDEPNTSNTVS